MNEILPTMIQAAVLLRIEELKSRGGPSTEDMEKAQKTSDMLGEHGDILLYGGGKKGQCADLFNRTAHAIAVLAFVPGGINMFGAHFEATIKEEGRST